MRFSPWLPVLLILALGAYLIPQQQPTFDLGAPRPEAADTLPGALPEDTRALFAAARPATVRVESLNPRSGDAGLGTGFFISETGQVLTAYHVVSTGTLFQINTLEGRALRARVTAFDAASDVALLQAQGDGPFPFLKLTARTPRVGEDVLAIGNSGGDYLQPRRGRLLALGAQSSQLDFPQGTLEMTAPLAPGDSGGPIIDGSGQAIGVISYIRVDESGQTRRSYAVPVPEQGDLVTALLAGEKRDVPVIGLVVDNIHSGVTDPPGAVIARVARGSPAAQAGLRASEYDENGNLARLGDIITRVAGQRTADADAFFRAVRGAQVGDSVEIEYSREGQAVTTTVTLVARATVPDLYGNE